MAPEPPSPSASTVLLPFLGGTSSRRGSLASVTSRREIDRDVLAQTLDHIHTSASRSEALTSFHDFDGGASGNRANAKELVSNGVSGLYNKFRQSVSTGVPAKEGKGRPPSSASKESIRSASTQSSVLPASKTAARLSLRTTAPVSPSLPVHSAIVSPVNSTFISNSDGVETQKRESRFASTISPSRQTNDESFSDDQAISIKDHAYGKRRQRTSQEAPSQLDIDRARGALLDDDRSELATQALARVLSHHEPPIGELSRTPRSMHLGADVEQAIEDNDGLPTVKPRDNAALRVALSPGVHRSSFASGEQSLNDTGRQPRRPPIARVGASHLPGFDPSRASSPLEQPVSSSSSQSALKTLTLDPSPNFNAGFQRKRADLRADLRLRPTASQPAPPLPPHLKRRVISKEFWMKDENAKVCFDCGQSFSTFRRKHHCRTCGQIFDAKCTSLVSGRPFGQPGTLRLCKPCEDMIFGSNDDDSSYYTDDGEDTGRSPPRNVTIGNDEFLLNLDGIANGVPSAREVMTPSIGIPASRRNRESKRRSAVIEFDAQPALARPSSSRSLVSMTGRPRSSSHRRHHSKHQPMRGVRLGPDERGPFYQDAGADPEKRSSLPAFHNDNIIDPDLAPFLSDDGSDEEDQPSIFSTISGDAHAASPSERERLGFGGLFASAMRKGRSKLGDRGTAPSSVRGVKEDDGVGIPNRHLPKLSRKRNPSISSITLGRPSPRRSRSTMLLKTHETDDSVYRPETPPTAPDVEGLKLIRSSSLRGAGAPPIELNRASLEHVRKLLAQLLGDANVEHAAAWEKALVPVLLQCTDDVEPDVQRGDDMDVRHYIKLKKVPGGKPIDTSYVSGVVFSKNIALKSMSRSIRNPRIAIITFSLEYARHQSHFMSLEPVIAQEREYLHNLVGRIANLRPSLLLVQRNVSGLALRLLDQAGITVAYNIKESVLAAVARVTQTSMIRSVDKLAIDPDHLGHCDSFDVKTYVHQGIRKNYVVLSGCQPDLGCTIVLRGADTKVLRTIKRITEFMCYVVYNLKLETYLMRDEFISIPMVRHEQLEASSRRAKHASHGNQDALDESQDTDWQFDSANPSKYAQVEEKTRSRILSASPFVVFMQPYLLTQLRESERKLARFKTLRDLYAAADEEGDDEKTAHTERFSLVKPEMVHTPPSKDQPKAVREYLHAVHSAQFDRVLATYDTQRKQWDSFVVSNDNPFDPFSHQTIVVLHSTVCSVTSAPCSGPELMALGFYAGYSHVEPEFEEDCTLGQYIEDICINAGKGCRECNRKMYDHHRQYVHGYGQLAISVQRQPARMRGLSNTILMWSSCRICRQETTIVPMSDNTWKYSFAKYLELSFWSSPLHPRAGICGHDIHKDFLRCFGFQDLVVRVQYDPVDIYDIVVPRPTIIWKVEADLTVKNEQYLHIEARLNAFVDSVKKRLMSINVDTLDEKQMMEAQETLDELRKRADDDYKELLEKLQRRYASSRYYELIPLNRALRFMDEKALQWDEAFNNFERDFFPSENDIRKLAAAQLKEMFYGSHSSTDSIASDLSDSEGGTEMKSFPSKSLGQQIADEEVESEKAHGVLTSVAQEHRAVREEDGNLNLVKSHDTNTSDEHTLTGRMSPHKEQIEAVERDNVRHLDLAVVAKSPPDTSMHERKESIDQPEHTSRPATRDGPTEEPFATQPKPLSSGLLQRIEQIRNNQGGLLDDSVAPESRIPRLANLKRRDVSPVPAPAPPLLRAQSQPTHVPRRSADLSLDFDPLPELETPMLERRLQDRLHRLGNHMAKITPSLIPRSIPTKGEHGTSNNVSALAKHFEQMSREFEKERLRERKQRAAKSRQARANPLASSRPIVEVYRNATDAVGARDTEPAVSTSEPTAPTISRVDTAPGLLELSSDETRPDDTQHVVAGVAPENVENIEAESITTDTEGEIESSDTEDASRTQDTSDLSSDVTASALLSSVAPDLDLQPVLSIPEHKKSVWFKMLADFWSKRSASGWTNLEYPLHSTEHVFEDSDIIVREDEPSSVIALSLACNDYLNKVKEFRSHPNKVRGHAHTSSQASNSFVEEDARNKAIEASLLSDTGTHMKYSFAHGTVKASCKIFYAESFDALRRRCGVADRFVESMSRCLKFDSKGGKTKSLFLKTLDNRFIIKSLQEVELKAFTKFAPDYFAFMSYTLFHGVPSVIAKMFGLFQVTIKNPTTGMDFSYYLLVMENLFYEHTPNRRFDLKGSMRNRKIESTGQPDEVLLDENLVETIFESPLFVREHSRKLLQASVWNDTLWLCKQNVMDYSLMAGFDDTSKQLVVGIIDCIRTYTWDKKLESWIKDRGKNKPTITSPKDYRNRFRVSMMQYVLQAPNCWHQFQAQLPPPKTLKEREEFGQRGTVQAGGNGAMTAVEETEAEVGASGRRE